MKDWVQLTRLGSSRICTIYEGLLESELSLAEENLTVDKKGFYKPAKENDEIIVSSGEVYIHNSSGAEKQLALIVLSRLPWIIY